MDYFRARTWAHYAILSNLFSVTVTYFKYNLDSSVSGCVINGSNQIKLCPILRLFTSNTILEELIEVAKIELSIPNLLTTCHLLQYILGV